MNQTCTLSEHIRTIQNEIGSGMQRHLRVFFFNLWLSTAISPTVWAMQFAWMSPNGLLTPSLQSKWSMQFCNTQIPAQSQVTCAPNNIQLHYSNPRQDRKVIYQYIYHRQYFSWMQLFYLFAGLLCACLRLRAPRNANSMPQVCRRWSSIRWRVSSASGRLTVATKTKALLLILESFIYNDSQNTGDLYVNATVIYIHMLFKI